MEPVIAPSLLAQVSPAVLAALPTPRCQTNADGDRFWRLPDGRLHRLDGPAVERANGQREWRANGELHRLDGPAVEGPGSFQAWWVAGARHRLDGPAVEEANGTREWWVAGHRHRTGGPAIEYPDGRVRWWAHNQVHRADGPACEQPDGRRQWWWEGVFYAWAMPAALWREAVTRESLGRITDPVQQRAKALALFSTLTPELQLATVAEALADPDAELRLWGLRAATLVARSGQTDEARADDTAVAPMPAAMGHPKPRLR